MVRSLSALRIYFRLIMPRKQFTVERARVCQRLWAQSALVLAAALTPLNLMH